MLAARSSVHTMRWAAALAERGHDVHLVSARSKGDGAELAGVSEHLLPFPAPLGYLLNGGSLRRLLHRLRPDLLHAHYASGYGTLARLSAFHPCLLSAWGSDVYAFPGQSPLHRRVIADNFAAADRVSSTSRAMAARIRELQPAVRSVDVVPFGIDCQRFAPRAVASDPGTLTIGTVKALTPVYGIDVLIRAFAAVRARLLGTDPDLARHLRLLIVGDGPERKALERLTRELGIADDVEFAGKAPHHRVPTFLRRLDVYAALSRSEGFGVAVLEASACGVPVVVSDAGGLPEVVLDGVTGLVVRRENVRAATAALLRLIGDSELRSRMGRAGREHVLAEYEWTSCVRRMEDVYHQLLAQSEPRSGGQSTPAREAANVLSDI